MFVILLGFIQPQCWTFCGSVRKTLWKRFVIRRKLIHLHVLHLLTVAFSGFSRCDQSNGAKFSKPLECLRSLNLAAFQQASDPCRQAAGAWMAESPVPGESRPAGHGEVLKRGRRGLVTPWVLGTAAPAKANGKAPQVQWVGAEGREGGPRTWHWL